MREPVTRQLPTAPGYLKEAPVPAKGTLKGQDASVVIEGTRQTVRRQNIVIRSAKKAWERMRSTYQHVVR